MTNFSKAAVTATVVGVLLSLLRRSGPRASGLAAAVPVSSVPALFWLSVAHGDDFASIAAMGALWGTGLAVLLAALHARLSTALRTATAAKVAFSAVVVVAFVSRPYADTPAIVGVFTLVAVACSLQMIPRPPATSRPRIATLRDTLIAMGAAGAMSFIVNEVSKYGGPTVSGLVAAIPIVGLTGSVAAHHQGGSPHLVRFLRGYVDGMFAKAAFLCALAGAWSFGMNGLAWLVATAAAVATLAVQQLLRQRPGQRSGRAIVVSARPGSSDLRPLVPVPTHVEGRGLH